MKELLTGANAETIRVVAAVILGFIICFFIRGNSTRLDTRRPNQPLAEPLIDWVSYIGLAVGCIFWVIYWWDHYHPELTTGFASYMTWLLVLGLGVAQPLGLPLLITLAAPRDPVNLYIQEQVQDTKAHKLQMVVTALQTVVSLVMVYRYIGTALGMTDTQDRIYATVTLATFSAVLPALSMFRVLKQSWRAELDLFDEVERRRRLAITEHIKIEAAMAQFIALQTTPFLQDAVADNTEIARRASRILAALIIRVNESNRTIGIMIGSLLHNPNIRIQTPTDQEVYATLEDVLLSVQQTDEAMAQLAEPEEMIAIPRTAPRTAEGKPYDRLNANRGTARER